jgi:hypothetical protein
MRNDAENSRFSTNIERRDSTQMARNVEDKSEGPQFEVAISIESKNPSSLNF